MRSPLVLETCAGAGFRPRGALFSLARRRMFVSCVRGVFQRDGGVFARRASLPVGLYWLLKMANAQHEIVAKIARLPRRVVAPNCAHETRADF